MKRFVLEVSGDFACFTRPEMKVERVSYEVITPSAARAVFEAILWKPVVRWHVRRIEVLEPVKWINLRRNEVGARISTRNVTAAMNGGGPLALHVEDERQQRAGLFLRDVAYRLHADLEVVSEREGPAVKYFEMFERRAAKGQCVNQPYLGCREFAADFRLATEEGKPPIPEDRELGWMLYDLDYSDRANPAPRFFNAALRGGVVEVPEWESGEVRG
ncbi:type I-C CRISPR-associated protein Cas5c [Endothiovibrio diazotrophicus]